MGYPVKRDDIVRRALEKADVDASVLAAGGPGWLTTDEVTDLVVESAARFYDIEIDVLGPETFAKELIQDFGPTIQPPPVLLPADFYRLVSVHVCDEIDYGKKVNFQSVEPVDSRGSIMTELLNTPPADGPFFYQLRRVRTPASSTYREQLDVWPYPTRDRFFRVMYVPSLDRDTSDGDNTAYDGVNGWDQWVVLDVAIAILTKEESDTSLLERERDRVEARIRSKHGKQDSFRARVPIDVKGAVDGHVRDPRWPR